MARCCCWPPSTSPQAEPWASTRGGRETNLATPPMRRDALAEGVADRVELHTADMTQLPFEQSSFDYVFSNVAMHNVKGHVARRKAIAEAVRVLRPDGRLMIADIVVTREYLAHCAALGMIDITRRNLGWRLWWSGPWLPTYLVTAGKPEQIAVA